MESTMDIPVFGYTALTREANKIVPPKRFLRDAFFPRSETHGAATVAIDVEVGGKKLAPIVARGAAAKDVAKLGKQTNLVEPPSVSMKKSFSASELNLERALGASPIVVGVAPDEARKRKIARELQDMKDRAVRLQEWMIAQAIATGEIIGEFDGVELAYDFRMPSTHVVALAGDEKWDASTTADPIGDLKTQIRKIQRATGYSPTVAVATGEVWDLFLAADSVQSYLDARRISMGVVDRESDDELGITRHGRLLGVDLIEYNEYYLDDDDVAQSMIPENVVVIGAKTPDNRMHYAAVDHIEAGGLVETEFFAHDWTTPDPSRYHAALKSSFLPGLHVPEAFVSLKVA
jgi:hypothetical protein